MEPPECSLELSTNSISRDRFVTPSFHRFPLLPPELRLKIWHETLPSDTMSALLPFRQGDEDNWHEVQGAGNSLDWSWVYDMSSHYSIAAPLLTVNHEARKVMLNWGARKSSRLLPKGSFEYPSYSRNFDQACDAVYIPPDQLRQTTSIVWHTGGMLNLACKSRAGASPLGCLALPATVLDTEDDTLELTMLLLSTHHSTKRLLFVIDPPAELSTPRETLSPSLWEYKSPDQGHYVSSGFGDTTSASDEFGLGWSFLSGSSMGNAHVHERIRKLISPDGMLEGFGAERQLEIWTVVAHERFDMSYDNR